MQANEEIGLKVAEFLLQIKAIELKPGDPYNWASGWKSPIYCDNRKTLSYPQVRTYIRQQFVETIIEEFGKPDVIVGVATGGVPLGVLVAQDLGLPFAYVRAQAKDHGLGNRIEGMVESGQSVVVVEDLVSTGKSSLSAVEALKEVGAKIKGMVAIFTYGFDISKENFKKANCRLVTLTNYNTLVKQALKSDYITTEQVETLQDWRKDPSNWQPVVMNK